MFRPAVIHTNTASVGTGIKASLRGSAKTHAKLSFALSTAVASRLGWAAGDKIEVLIGEEEHHGFVRARKNNSVGQVELQKRGSDTKSYLSISLGHQPLYVNRTEASRWCQWDQHDAGWVQIKLPAWAFETATSTLKKQVVSDPVRGPQARAKSFGSVTSSLMGDPDPSRSALAQRGK